MRTTSSDFIIDAGHTAQRVEHDYGYDLNMTSYDEQGFVEPGSVYIQLKAAETLEASGPDYLFDIDIRDYNLWRLELMPVILVLFDAARRKAYWLYVQRYFRQDPSRQPQKAVKTVRLRVPGARLSVAGPWPSGVGSNKRFSTGSAG